MGSDEKSIVKRLGMERYKMETPTAHGKSTRNIPPRWQQSARSNCVVWVPHEEQGLQPRTLDGEPLAPELGEVPRQQCVVLRPSVGPGDVCVAQRRSVGRRPLRRGLVLYCGISAWDGNLYPYSPESRSRGNLINIHRNYRDFLGSTL